MQLDSDLQIIRGNLLLGAEAYFNGLAGKDDEHFWSTGASECWKKPKP